MKFFEFSQNNSGGWFDTEYGHYVFIEAETADAANKKAEDVGLYFDGCASGMDCNCCGDRWYPQWNEDGEEEPTVWLSAIGMPAKYRDEIEEGATTDLQLAANCDTFFSEGDTVISVYCADGSVVRYKKEGS